MKGFFTLIIFLLNVFALSAQDLIVTHAGDSINAKIIKIKSGYIYYNYKYRGNVHNAIMHPDSITFYQYNFYKWADVPAYKVITREELSNWRIALNGGWSWRVAPSDPSLNAFEKKYIDELKSGYQLGGEAAYYFHRFMGVGLVYNAYFSKNSIYATAQFPNGTYATGILSDNILINYIGPTFNLRFMSRRTTNVFVMAATIGYTNYRDNAAFITPIKITGQTVGLNYDLGYDFGISKHLALGAGLSLKVASLTSIEITENGNTHTESLDQNSYESLARVDIYFGVRFR